MTPRMLMLTIWLVLPGHMTAQEVGETVGTRGRQLELRLGVGPVEQVRGELLAVGRDSVWLLSSGSVVTIPMERVRTATVRRHGMTTTKGLLWGVGVGLISGIGLMVACNEADPDGYCGLAVPASAAIGLAFGGLAALSFSHSSQWRYDPVVADSLVRFARFPQGAPAGVLEQLGPAPPDAKRRR